MSFKKRKYIVLINYVSIFYYKKILFIFDKFKFLSFSPLIFNFGNSFIPLFYFSYLKKIKIFIFLRFFIHLKIKQYSLFYFYKNKINSLNSLFFSFFKPIIFKDFLLFKNSLFNNKEFLENIFLFMRVFDPASFRSFFCLDDIIELKTMLSFTSLISKKSLFDCSNFFNKKQQIFYFQSFFIYFFLFVFFLNYFFFFFLHCIYINFFLKNILIVYNNCFFFFNNYILPEYFLLRDFQLDYLGFFTGFSNEFSIEVTTSNNSFFDFFFNNSFKE